MKIIITEEQYNSLNEMIKLDIKVGDTLMGGKFKNKKVVVKTIGKNDKGDITINGKPLLRFRLLKEDIPTEKSVNLFKKWLYTMYDEISFLEINKTYDGYPLIIIYYTTDDNAANYSSWLTMDITEKWNKMTGGLISTQPVWYSKIPDNVKFLITAEDADLYNDEDEETINENDNSKVGDTLMGGKFKNKKVVVKTIGKNDKGDITINGKPLLRFRMLKENVEIPENKILDIFKKWLYNNYPNISFLEVTRKKDPYLNPSRFKDIPLVIVHYTESDAGDYATWQPNYRSWLTMDIVDTWNKITDNTMPITGSFYERIDHKNVKILVDAEEFSEDEDEPINESVNPKILDLFDGYIKKVHPEFLVKNTSFRMSSGEDTLYLHTHKGPDNNPSTLFIVIERYNDFDDKHMYFTDDSYVDMFNNVFGDDWAELFLHWANKEYEHKLKRIFNEINWEITGVN